MKKVFVFCLLLVLIVLAGCIKIKQPCLTDHDQIVSEKDDNNLLTGSVVVDAKEVISTKDTIAAKKDEEPIKKATEDTSTLKTKNVLAGEWVSFPNLDAIDPDGEPITYKFSAPLDDNGEWLTTPEDIGEYIVTITISDGKNKVQEKILIIVTTKNSPPVIEAPQRISVQEGDTLEIPMKVTDADGDAINIRYSGWIYDLPYKVDDDDQGNHVLRIHASDGKQEVVHEVIVAVRNVNRPPQISSINDVTIEEGDKVTIIPKATDPDGDAISYRFGEPLDSKGTWIPQSGDEGTYEVKIVATDGMDESSTSFFVIVGTNDRAPVIEGIKDIAVDEGDSINLQITAEDPEGQETTISISGYMDSMTKITSYEDAGIHTVRVTASDGTKTTTKTFKITVSDVNRPPVFSADAFD